MHWLGIIRLVTSGTDGVGIGRDARSGRGIGSNSSLPCFFEEMWGDPSTVLSSDNPPEGSSVCLVDVTKAFLVNVGNVHWA